MDREGNHRSKDEDADVRDADAHEAADEHRCMLCDVVIEIAEHEIFFATGRCRFCHSALEDEE